MNKFLKRPPSPCHKYEAHPYSSVVVFADVAIDIQSPLYIVMEGEGPVEVCAEITDGSLERTVVVLLSTGNGGTATGMRVSTGVRKRFY